MLLVRLKLVRQLIALMVEGKQTLEECQKLGEKRLKVTTVSSFCGVKTCTCDVELIPKLQYLCDFLPVNRGFIFSIFLSSWIHSTVLRN